MYEIDQLTFTTAVQRRGNYICVLKRKVVFSLLSQKKLTACDDE